MTDMQIGLIDTLSADINHGIEWALNAAIEAFAFILEHSNSAGDLTLLRHPGQNQGYIKEVPENLFADWHILLALSSGAALRSTIWCSLFLSFSVGVLSEEKSLKNLSDRLIGFSDHYRIKLQVCSSFFILK